jgi:uncharacterized hydrophobic protein (TIGR00271 family)
MGAVVPDLGVMLHGGVINGAEIDRVRDVLLFEEPRLRERLIRFWALLIMASSIATYGLIGDAVATVIGAMIVAPLMLPIMGLAFGITIGDRRAITSSLAVGLGGIVTSIAVGYVLAIPFSRTLDPESVSQIMSRTSPHLVDLCAALATGLAGAFAIGRKDVSDTLPGVAIAISLVPPLANVGILMACHRPELALGSLLLFCTNYLAIVLTGSIVFALMGYPQAVSANRSPRARRAAVALVIVLVCAVTVPLGVASYQLAVSNLAERRATVAVDEWVKGSAYRVVSVTVDGDVRIVVAGNGALPSVDTLKRALRGELFGMPVSLEAVPEQRQTFSSQ